MGKIGTRSEDRSTEEIQKSLIKEFGIDNKHLYDFWMIFLNKIEKGYNYKESLQYLKDVSEHTERYKGLLDYFTIVGLLKITRMVFDSAGGNGV